MYFLFLYENKRMKHVEIVLKRGGGSKENAGRGKSKIYCRCICTTIIC
jgi:hypothetical protein